MSARRYRLLASPMQAVRLVDTNLHAVPGHPPGAGQIAQWIADLDAKSFRTRRHASEALAELGRAAKPALTKALADKPSLERRRRIKALLNDLTRSGPALADIRPARALEMLEHIGSPKARAVLRRLAQGRPNAWLTQAAMSSLARLRARSGK